MLRILIADDHEMIKEGLKHFINGLLSHVVIDTACDGDSAIEKIKKHEYNLIILDVNMPGTDSFGLVSNIRIIMPNAKILIYSMNAENVYAKRYLQLGANGYVNKTASPIELATAINAVLSKDRYFSADLIEIITEEAFGKKANNPFDKLSSREFEILQHLINGESLRVISNTFNLHTSTVSTHKARIFEKLKCKNIMEVSELAKVYKVIP